MNSDNTKNQEVDDNWGQMLSLDDVSGYNLEETLDIPVRDSSPCSSYLSRSNSGYFVGSGVSNSKNIRPSFADDKHELAFELNSRSLSWFPPKDTLFRGAYEASRVPKGTQLAPFNMDFDSSVVFKGSTFNSDSAEFSMNDIFEKDTNDFYKGVTDTKGAASIDETTSMPTYACNPWSIVPMTNSSFVCNWSADSFDCSPGRPSNAYNARIRLSLNQAGPESLPMYSPKVSSYYLKKTPHNVPITEMKYSKGLPPTSFSHSQVRPQRSLVYQVHFKHYCRDYTLHPFVKTAIHIGDIVRADADRGEDIGHVTSISTLSNDVSLGRLGYIMRLATAEEKYMLPIKAKEEWDALEVCRQMTYEHQLAMNILDAEYQYDRRKLTFFFEAGGRIDFRTLVPSLFATYKTRIWMQQVQVNSEGEFESVFA